jgi:hypothetical protein
MGAEGLPHGWHWLPRLQAAGDRRHPARTAADARTRAKVHGRSVAPACDRRRRLRQGPPFAVETMRDVREAMGLSYIDWRRVRPARTAHSAFCCHERIRMLLPAISRFLRLRRCPRDAGEPSRWVLHWAHLVAPGGTVLDVASGAGRHARWFAGRGHPVSALDRDAAALAAMRDEPQITTLAADLEGAPWPLPTTRNLPRWW